MFQQQGDVIIKKSEIPSTAKPISSNVLAEGEATGHAHRVIGTDFQVLEQADQMFLRVSSDDCVVTHEEHGNQTIIPGEYKINKVVEYDHMEEEAREVRD